MATLQNWYEILCIEHTATDKEIATAYRKQSKKCHPDKHPNDKAALARFLKLKEAVDVLTDPAQRRALDEKLKAVVQQKKREAEMDKERQGHKRKLEEREKTAGQTTTQLSELDQKKMEFKAKLKRDLEEKRAAKAKEEAK
eukprot:c23338_g1_i1.p1 GENE.c23338_g1_i1~~c23338_g1_i1.p1  ORF type:complete len:158 (-),score=34.78 c23338_g1_i1:272-694(-)